MKEPKEGNGEKTYVYYPGCSLSATGVAYDESLRTLFRLLSLRLQELEDWNCCGATSYMCIDEGSAFLLSARNLSLAQKVGARELVAPCAACYLVLRKTQDYVEKHREIGGKVAESLKRAGLPPLDGVKVRHPLEVLYNDLGVEKLRQLAVRQWRGGRIACYYGCQAVRPYDEVDRPHNPMRMDELLRAVGVPTVDYALKTKCCGGSLTGTVHEVGLRLNYILLKEARRKGAEAIVTLCPLCQFNLDVYHAEIARQSGERFDMPVLYFTQVLGWALGGDFKELGLKRSISGSDLIRRWFTANEEVEAYV
ncbi:MAG: CoB--CoM heterodisulfide reductase iron-sulfur subunit B family protein [Bryobacteraceae bacterium]|nr:CoB--CoM heterodisulfide reductase iron-sulfur subunit B family protein [Bryobacteraceae bacterium]